MGLVVETADAPRESGWFSGNALLPGIVVITATGANSASRSNSSDASE